MNIIREGGGREYINKFSTLTVFTITLVHSSFVLPNNENMTQHPQSNLFLRQGIQPFTICVLAKTPKEECTYLSATVPVSL